MVIEGDCYVGDNSFVGNHVVMRPGVKIGSDCMIGHGTVFEGDTLIGDRVLIHAQCHITQHVTMEDDVFLGPMVMTINTRNIKHGRESIELDKKGPYICRAARIGGGSSILPGITIGENALIGAGSVVTKDVPDREVWIGVPAKKVRDVMFAECL